MENGDGERFRRIIPVNRDENGSGDEDGGRRRVRGVMGAPRKALCYNDLTLFRVGIFITLKMA